jgi:uncharacterized protein DUF4124
MFRILAIAGALLGLASAAQADVWRWTDPNGTIHYSDSWVPGSTQVKTGSGYSSPSSSDAPSSNGASPTPSEQADAQRDQRTVAEDVAKVKAEECKKATEAYEKAIHSRRIYQDKPGGEREYLNDKDADAYRLQLLNARKQVCGA